MKRTPPSVVSAAKRGFFCKCTLAQVAQLQGADGGSVPTWVTLSELVPARSAQALPKNGIYIAAAARHILRGGGSADYFSVRGWGK